MYKSGLRGIAGGLALALASYGATGCTTERFVQRIERLSSTFEDNPKPQLSFQELNDLNDYFDGKNIDFKEKADTGKKLSEKYAKLLKEAVEFRNYLENEVARNEETVRRLDPEYLRQKFTPGSYDVDSEIKRRLNVLGNIENPKTVKAEHGSVESLFDPSYERLTRAELALEDETSNIKTLLERQKSLVVRMGEYKENAKAMLDDDRKVFAELEAAIETAKKAKEVLESE